MPYQMPYPGPEAYHFSAGPSHTSPCMDPYWTSQAIRTGKVRDDIEHEEKPEETEL